MSRTIIAVLNCGSSSVKFSLFDMKEEKSIFHGLFENIGHKNACCKVNDKTLTYPSSNYQKALQEIGQFILQQLTSSDELIGIGHRVVHGGVFFNQPTLINTEVEIKLRASQTLAPLHNPANLLGIHAMQQRFPHIPQVAVFDTAFHQSIPPAVHIYAIPYYYYIQHHIRRYGFHGISHEYIGKELSKRLDKPFAQCSCITAHLGNGCSVTAIEHGKSVDTSMGFTPLEGLMMGTRSGSVDPSLIETLARIEKTSPSQITTILNRKSGLLGISGLSHDMRTIAESSDSRSLLAMEMFVDRLAKTIAGMRSALSTFDGLVFAGGIGENSAEIRARTVQRLGFLGISIDKASNLNHGSQELGRISRETSPGVWVIHTDEEKMIAKQTLHMIS